MSKLTLAYPIKPFTITQKFGENLNPIYAQLGMKGHNGWDMVGWTGQLIRASHNGVVTFTGEDSSGGLGVVIRTTEEFDYKEIPTYFKSIFWHCKPNTFKVKPGDVVKTGDALAECDSTGQSTSSHLHYGLKPVFQGEKDWEWYNLESDNGYKGSIDPEPYWSGDYAEDIWNLQSQINFLQKIVEILKKLLNLK